MMKKIVIGFLSILMLVVLGGYFLFTNLDVIIRTNVAKYASAATQAKVDLDTVKLSLSSGDGMLKGLSIGNPKGFTTPQSFYLGLIEVTVDLSSLHGDGPIVIKTVVIDKPQVIYELLNDGTSNLQTIQNNALAYAHSLSDHHSTNASKDDQVSDQPGRKVIIRDLVIRNGVIAISQEMLKGKQLSARLPEIHLTNIGKDSGVSVAQVTEQIFGTFTSAATQASVAQLAKEKIGGLLKRVPAASISKAAVENVGGQLKGILAP